MRPFWTDSTEYSPKYSSKYSPKSLAQSPFSTHIHPALTSFADEVCATIARLFAYVGTLALIAILSVHFWNQLPALTADGALAADWSLADHSQPAFALGAENHTDKSIAYTILRHPQGGRKDIFTWPGQGERAIAELEIYCMGDEAASASPPQQDLGLRMPPGGELEAAGVVDSKFGTVALLWRASATAGSRRQHGAAGCLGFFRTIDDPAMRISGWSCEGDGLPAQRSAVACMLDRLTLLTSGNEPKLAELFARAELNRRNCGGAGPAASGDWISQADNPHLRGPL
ncbi:MAG TPA: hypothetical protein VFB02_11020 [Bradyrhizobium sp.]|nr:hypothetical protein [Bradyrhizobium sp.]